MSSLNIRPATVAASDHELLVDFKDSQISWLSSIGSGDQWGRQAIREVSPNISERMFARVQSSEAGHEWGPSWCRAWIAEAQPTETASTSAAVIPVAGLVLEGTSAAYVRSILPEQDPSDPFVYLGYLISSRDAGELRAGAGAVLIDFAKKEAQKLGIHRICVDCWRGNGGKLIGYYERQGFTRLGDFTVPEKNNWPGSVLEMRI